MIQPPRRLRRLRLPPALRVPLAAPNPHGLSLRKSCHSLPFPDACLLVPPSDLFAAQREVDDHDHNTPVLRKMHSSVGSGESLVSPELLSGMLAPCMPASEDGSRHGSPGREHYLGAGGASSYHMGLQL